MPIPSGEKKCDTETIRFEVEEFDMEVKDIDRSKEPVLVVDDDQRVAEVLGELLSALDFPCDEALSGSDGLKKLGDKDVVR